MNGIQKSPLWIGPQISNIQGDMEMNFLDLDRIPIIIGLTGATKSGKTIVARRMVAEFGFYYYNLSALIREYSRNLGLIHSNWEKRKNLAEAIRIEHGDDILARWAIQRINTLLTSGGRIVLDGILHPAEALFLKKLRNYFMVGMKAPLAVRYNQAHRWYPEEYTSIEIINTRDKYEHVDSRYKIQSPHAPNIKKCLELADFHVEIDKEFNDESVYSRADQVVKEILLRSNI